MKITMADAAKSRIGIRVVNTFSILGPILLDQRR